MPEALCTVKIVFFNLESGLAESLSDVFQASDGAEMLPSALEEPHQVNLQVAAATPSVCCLANNCLHLTLFDLQIEI